MTGIPVVDKKCSIFYDWGALTVCSVFAEVFIKEFLYKVICFENFPFSFFLFCTVFLSLGIMKCWQSFLDSPLEWVFAWNEVVQLFIFIKFGGTQTHLLEGLATIKKNGLIRANSKHDCEKNWNDIISSNAMVDVE